MAKRAPQKRARKRPARSSRLTSAPPPKLAEKKPLNRSLHAAKATKQDEFYTQLSDNMKREAYERQKGVCKKCKKKFDLSEMEADHIKPWHEGGKTDAKNCQMLCKDDNRRKAGK